MRRCCPATRGRRRTGRRRGGAPALCRAPAGRAAVGGVPFFPIPAGLGRAAPGRPAARPGPARQPPAGPCSRERIGVQAKRLALGDSEPPGRALRSRVRRAGAPFLPTQACNYSPGGRRPDCIKAGNAGANRADCSDAASHFQPPAAAHGAPRSPSSGGTRQSTRRCAAGVGRERRGCCCGTSRPSPAFCCRQPGRPRRLPSSILSRSATLAACAARSPSILAACAARSPFASPSSAAIMRLAASSGCPPRRHSRAGTGSRRTPPRTARASQPDTAWARLPEPPCLHTAFEAHAAGRRGRRNPPPRAGRAGSTQTRP